MEKISLWNALTPPRSGWKRTVLLTLYYAAVLAGVVILQARGSLTTPSFVYQGF